MSAVGIMGCGESTPSSAPASSGGFGNGGSGTILGGTTSSGGNSAKSDTWLPAIGGTTATHSGGTPSATGGAALTSGGTVSTSSVNATGGIGASTGGSRATGGAIAAGGARATGGAPLGSAGSPATGGNSATGGAAQPSTGGAKATGSTTSNTNGGNAAGGNAAGGNAAGGNNGTSATGGVSGSSGYSPCPTNGDPCKILPFGDSITDGVASTDLGGYRSQLFKLIIGANQKITFTGSQSSGPAQVSGTPFPKNHEGHSGWTIEPGYSAYGADGITTLVPSPAFNTIPNIVLLMIGTNDVTANSGQSTMPNRLEGLLDKIVLAAPNALIVLAKLTPVSWNPSALTDYNAKIPGIVSARAAKGQHIVAVDMSQMPLTSLDADKVHPNDQGYSYMAGVWYAAIKNLLPK